MTDCEHCNNPILDAVTGQVMHANCAREAVRETRRCLFCKKKKPARGDRFCSKKCKNDHFENSNLLRPQPKKNGNCIMCGGKTKGTRKTCSELCKSRRKSEVASRTNFSINKKMYQDNLKKRSKK